MGKRRPQIGMRKLSKKGPQIMSKGKNTVKVADQPPVKITWRLKDKVLKLSISIIRG